MNRPKYGVLLVLVVITLLGCDNSTNAIFKNPIDPEDFQVFFQPGTTWSYVVSDTAYNGYTHSFSVQWDTVKIVVEPIKGWDQCDQIVKWVISGRTMQNTWVICQKTDSVLFFQRVNEPHPTLMAGFVFPLQPGMTWHQGIADYQVDRAGPLEVPFGTVAEVIRIRQKFRIGNSFGADLFFLHPEFGILRYYQGTGVTLSEINHFVSWELLSKSIKE